MRWQEIAATVERDGYALLRGGSSELWILEATGALIGGPLEGTFEHAIGDVVFNQASGDASRSIANSDKPMYPHTDGSFDDVAPTDVLLQCVQADRPGYGDTVIVDTQALMSTLSGEALRSLSVPEFDFGRVEGEKNSHVRKAVCEKSERPSIRYREDEKYAVRPGSAAGADALVELRQAIRSGSHQQRLRLDPGDIIWLDNTRILHGRTSLSGHFPRRLRRLRLIR